MSNKKTRGKGEGSLYQRGDGKWVAQVEAGYTAKGRRRYRRAVRSKKTEAQTELGRLLREQRATANLPEDIIRRTLDHYLAEWLEAVEPTISPKTYESYEQFTRLHITPAIGRISLGKLGPQHVQQMMTAVRRKGLAESSVAYARTVLGIALQQAVDWGVLDRNVARMVKAPKVETDDPQALTVAEASTILEQLADDRLYALYAVALAIGLRVSEAIGLRWSDVDLNERVLKIRKQLARVEIDGLEGRHYVLRETKRKKSRRTIPLPAFAVPILAEHRKRQAAEKLAADQWVDGCCTTCEATGWGLVFTTNSSRTTGRALSRTWVLKHLQGIASKKNIEVTMHELRHTAATFLLAQGVPLAEIQEILGHSSIQITKDMYGHLEVEHLRGAAAAMDRVLGSGS